MIKKELIAIIPARENSKRIAKKNYKKFNGKPIILQTIEKLKRSKLFDKIVVSTDSLKIASISKKAGAEIPFIRPKFLSNDYTSATSVISHCVSFLLRNGHKFDYVCCVYAPNPFLQIADLKKGYKKIKSSKLNYVFSGTNFRFPFFRSFTLSSSGEIKMLFNKNYYKRSQDLKEITCDAGQFYWGHRKSWLKQKKLFSKKSGIIRIPNWRYHDIDTLENWKVAEKFSKNIF